MDRCAETSRTPANLTPPDRHPPPAKRLVHPKEPIRKREFAVILDLPDDIAPPVLDLRYDERIGTKTRHVPTARRRQRQCFVRSFVIVTQTPAIKCFLCRRAMHEGFSGQGFRFERATEAFLFSLRLGTVWTTMIDGDSQSEQSDRQGDIPRAPVTPRCALPLKQRAQSAVHGAGLLIDARITSEAIARMIVEHGLGMTTTVPQGDIVHLPQIIRRGGSATLPRAMTRGCGGGGQRMPPQDGGDRAGGRNGDCSLIAQPPANLPSAPGRRHAPYGADCRFHRRIGLHR